VRHERRQRGPRSTPFQRDYAYPSEGESWSRGFGASVAPASKAAPAAAGIVGDTVRLSNLSTDLREDDLRYIFDKIGPIRGITIHFDAHQRSLGTAEIQFGSNAAAQAAVANLDQAEVDGRIMYVHLVGQVVVQPTVVPSSYARRGGYDDDRDDRRGGDSRRDGGNRRDDRRDDRRGGGGDDRRGGGERQQRPAQQQREGGGGRQGGGRQGGGRQGGAAGGAGAGGEGGKKKGGREARPEAKAEDLDAEMDNWHAAAKSKEAQPEAAAAAPAAAAPAEAAPMEGGQ
jgi:hypothetical protein